MTRKAFLWSVLTLIAGAGVVRAAEGVRILPVVRADKVVVSVELEDAYTDEVRAAIASGLRTTFTYDVELRMVVPVWVDPIIAASVVTISDQYDNLTRRHTLSRTVDGRVVASLATEDEATVRQWLTKLDKLPLCGTSKLDASRDYYVRISAQARPRGGSLLGWTSAVTGQAKFTFIP